MPNDCKHPALPEGWACTRESVDGSLTLEPAWTARRRKDCAEVWVYDDGQVEIDNIGVVIEIEELIHVLCHLRSRRVKP